MQLSAILSEKSVFPNVGASCDKQALTRVASEAAKLVDIPDRQIFNSLMERERLGSTGVGGGVAIPHARLKGLKNVAALFARLDMPVAYDARDGKPVDLLFVLLVPEAEHGQHLKALARISRVLGDETRCTAIREADSAREIYRLLTESDSQ